MPKRELIQPHPGDKRYARRDERGRFAGDQVEVGRSLSRDRRQHSSTRPQPAQTVPSRGGKQSYRENKDDVDGLGT